MSQMREAEGSSGNRPFNPNYCAILDSFMLKEMPLKFGRGHLESFDFDEFLK